MLGSSFFGLKWKLVLLVIAGIVTSFSIIGYFRVYVQEHRILDEVKRSGDERAKLLSEAVANMLISYDYTNMESLAERVMKQPDLRRITIRNRDGKVMVTREAGDAAGVDSMSFESPAVFGGEVVGKVEVVLTLERARREIVSGYVSVILEQVFFGVFLGMLIYLAVSRVIVKPVQEIGRHMKSLMQSDEVVPPDRISLSNRDEIGELAEIFNNMNRQIYGMQQRLREKIDLAGTALMETNNQLRQRTEELEQRSKQLEETLVLVEKMAVTDSLTGLHNRRHFDENLSSFFHLARRHHESLCLVLLDVDYFKQINDGYGHGAGDVVLHSLGGIFRSCVRETDITARLGGDEFAFLLYRADIDDAARIAKKCLELVGGQEFEFDGRKFRVTLSIGVASMNSATDSVEALYGAADQALYEAKGRGRNQVVTYPV